MAKQLLGTVDPWLLAGLLYLGSGVGLGLWHLLTLAAPVKLPADQRVWLAGALLAGGRPGPLLVAGALMAAGVWLHLTERHDHAHDHHAEEHDHGHEHDAHHRHAHAEGTVAGRHTHPYRHEPLTQVHAHFPYAHHQHGH